MYKLYWSFRKNSDCSCIPIWTRTEFSAVDFWAGFFVLVCFRRAWIDSLNVWLDNQEAFRIAAEKAKAAAESLKINLKSWDEDVGGCLSYPKPTTGDLKDAGIGLAGSTPVSIFLFVELKSVIHELFDVEISRLSYRVCFLDSEFILDSDSREL